MKSQNYAVARNVFVDVGDDGYATPEPYTLFTSDGWTPVRVQLGITSEGWTPVGSQILQPAVKLSLDLPRCFRTSVGRKARAQVLLGQMNRDIVTDPAGQQWFRNPTSGQWMQIAFTQQQMPASSPAAQFPAAGAGPALAGTPVQQMPVQNVLFPSPLPDAATWQSTPSAAQLVPGVAPTRTFSLPVQQTLVNAVTASVGVLPLGMAGTDVHRASSEPAAAAPPFPVPSAPAAPAVAPAVEATATGSGTEGDTGKGKKGRAKKGKKGESKPAEYTVEHMHLVVAGMKLFFDTWWGNQATPREMRNSSTRLYPWASHNTR